MLVLPVIDLQQGVAVHGRAGQRESYVPVRSVLASGASAIELARGYRDQLGLGQLYVADLDAIVGRPPAWGLHRLLLDEGFHVWLDAGIGSIAQVADVRQHLGDRVDMVLGLETLVEPDVVRDALLRVGSARVVVSLDLDEGRPRTSIPSWSQMDALTLALRLIELGVRRLILLDIRRVGTGRGTGTDQLLRDLRAHDSDVQICCGGGIRGMDDARRLASNGCDGVLLATVLHEGRMGRAEVEVLARSRTRPAYGT
jgi:phosphoribosylformimino-5-aminoimidazole carboxamide ribotide isomerase